MLLYIQKEREKKEERIMKLVPYRRNFLTDGFFSDFFNEGLQNVATPALKADVRQTDDSYIIEAEVAGVAKEDVSLICEKGVLTITVSKNEEKSEEKEGYIRKERYTGSSSRRFAFEDINEEDISAKMENGVLTVTLPKSKEAVKKQIDISVE
jgi:HSP20 family protein